MEYYDIIVKTINKIRDKDPFFCEVLDYLTYDNIEYKKYYSWLFTHRFAKVFWGENAGCHGNHYEAEESCWKCNLQQMVLKEEPLKYLEKFLK